LLVGLGDVVGRFLTRLTLGVGLGRWLGLWLGVALGEPRCCAVLLSTRPPVWPDMCPVR